MNEEENQPLWLVSHVDCWFCGHWWVAVHMLGCKDFECSKCGLNMGVVKFHYD